MEQHPTFASGAEAVAFYIEQGFDTIAYAHETSNGNRVMRAPDGREIEILHQSFLTWTARTVYKPPRS